jgi:hypothetical protein
MPIFAVTSLLFGGHHPLPTRHATAPRKYVKVTGKVINRVFLKQCATVGRKSICRNSMASRWVGCVRG